MYNGEFLREKMSVSGLYNPEDEHDACGVGFVASLDGNPCRSVVEKAIEALQSVWHRGAVDADGKTGDGAGIHLQIPQAFFMDHIACTGHVPRADTLAVGQIFLPRTDLDSQETCRSIVESEILNLGYKIYGWRPVPVNTEHLGSKASAMRPEIEQVMIANPKDLSDDEFERELYMIRRRIEKRVDEAQVRGFYICSLSCRSIIYKGMFLAAHISDFYKDLKSPDFISAFAIYHQRYSTNTFPHWWLAQPLRSLAHNGEINTIRGNCNWLKSHEVLMASHILAGDQEIIKPLIAAGSSDSVAMDAVFEIMIRAGRSVLQTQSLLMPEPDTSVELHRNPALSDMYRYNNTVMEPWDGPAAIVATDGRWVMAGMDRNGLRPFRYTVTQDGFIYAGSETGLVHVDDCDVKVKGRLGPGQMLGVDLQEGGLYIDEQIKDMLAKQQPYCELSKKITMVKELDSVILGKRYCEGEELLRNQRVFGYSMESLESIIYSMVTMGKEEIGSMGDDTPLAVLSDDYRPISHFFRQHFSQITNPPIDPLREQYSMCLKTRFCNLTNLLEERELDTGVSDIIEIRSPVILNCVFERLKEMFSKSICEIQCVFDINGGSSALSDALAAIRHKAEQAIRDGRTQIVLTDMGVSSEKAPIPMILATSAVHSWIVLKGLRAFCSILVRSAECHDSHYFSVLIGCGATVVNAWLAEESIISAVENSVWDVAYDKALGNFKVAIEQGILKIMSKRGISVISSYRGGYNFEAIGLSRALVTEYFPGMQSRISGIGLSGIQKGVIGLHKVAFAMDKEDLALPIGGYYKARSTGETHFWQAQSIHLLQTACTQNEYRLFQKYSEMVRNLPPIHLRDLLDFRSDRSAVLLDEVETITSIRNRFVTPGMSLGALSPEAHEILNVAMNRIGAKSNSGEGGEDPTKISPLPNGDCRSAKVKQVASGRFGVTAEYLNNCQEIEIKISQGAKPGEGGQLPGFKVTEMLAKLRHATPGVTLISPPPHHDIYSIEDIAQLIYDLKQINPIAKIAVKLVAATGVGTIAAGVAKAKADIILISGHNGGTAASPQTSIKFAGLPWEMGVAEVHQVLALNDLRDRVTLRADGGLRTGRDIVIAAMLGVEEYGMGTASLIAMGCIMVRQCQSNTCPVGVCTQNPALREKFTGTADKVVNLFTFVAQEVRTILASLGFRTLEEVIGRSDLLSQVSRGADHLDDLDLNPLLACVNEGKSKKFDRNRPRNSVQDSLDLEIIRDSQPFFENRVKMQLSYTTRNTDRAIGSRLSSHIVSRWGMDNGLHEGHLTVQLSGACGQSLGAFLAPGARLEVFGDANDYVGKGLSGGVITIRPPVDSPLLNDSQNNTIIGNTVLYGATAGKLFAAGQAGERFAVRNSGAIAVVEGCGSNGCEYMTGGAVAILGRVGSNFAAGMTGGMAYVYDKENIFREYLNHDLAIAVRVEVAHWQNQLKILIEEHAKETTSPWANSLLYNWDKVLADFWQIVPKEMLGRLKAPISVNSDISLAM